MNDSTRENLGSRLGFILLTAGCAIGLGNIWRFPFICGQYGGAIFVLIYLFFLITLGYPVMVMELALGRASRRNIVGAYTVLPASGKRNWRRIGMLFFTGNIILMIFYTSVTGWMIAYACKYLTGSIAGLPAEKVGPFFNNFLASPEQMVGYMLITVVGSSLVCALGLRRGVERITKILMGCLLLLLFGLCIRSCLLPGAGEGELDAAEEEEAVHRHIAQPLEQIDGGVLPGAVVQVGDGVGGAVAPEHHGAEGQIEPGQLSFSHSGDHGVAPPLSCLRKALGPKAFRV